MKYPTIICRSWGLKPSILHMEWNDLPRWASSWEKNNKMDLFCLGPEAMKRHSVWWICWMLQQKLFFIFFFLAVVLCKKSLWDWLPSIGLAEVASKILPVWGLSITMLTDSGLGFVLLHVFFSAFCSHQDLYLLTYWHTDLLILLYLTTYTQNSSYIATSERVQQWTVTFKTMASGGQHAIAEAPISHIAIL